MSCHFSAAALHNAWYGQTDVMNVPFSTLGFPAREVVLHYTPFAPFPLKFSFTGAQVCTDQGVEYLFLSHLLQIFIS